MPPKRGMSLEEKRATLLEIFHESKDVFLLKDVEKLGAKRGVVLQAIKDVLQSLVDDDLVRCERIGVSNFFWSFPSEAAVKLEGEAAGLRARLGAREAEAAALKAQLAESRAGREDSDERAALATEDAALGAEIAAKRAEVEANSANDPERFEALKQAAVVCRDSANRWTENVFTLQTWMRKKFPGQEAALAGFFKEQGAGEDFDYVA